MKFWYAILAAFAVMIATAPSRADTIELTVGECMTEPGGTYCSTAIDFAMNPAGTFTSKAHLYVSIDGGDWVQLACLQRPLAAAITQRIEINSIQLQHRYRFRRHAGSNCTPVTPGGPIHYATGTDQSLSEMAEPRANPDDWALVYRQPTPGAPIEFLRNCTEMVELKPGEWEYVAKTCWSTYEEGAQRFTRRVAHMLARMGFDANAAGAAYGGGLMASKYSSWATLPAPASCVIRSSQVPGAMLYWHSTYSKADDAWQWASGFADWVAGPIIPEPVFCGHELQPAALIVYHLKNEAINNLAGRNYGVREAVTGDRPICNPGFTPSLCY